MRKYFHVSTVQTAKAIVVSSDQRAQSVKSYFSPRKPRDHYTEKPDDRICVTPSAWQSLISCPDPQNQMYIYSLTCCGAIAVTKDEHKVDDAHVTHEHWITDNVIKQNGGQISMALVGVMDNTAKARFIIQKWLEDQRKAGSDLSKVDELKEIWIIKEQTNPAEWKLRLALREEPPGDMTLPLPSSWND